MPSLRGRGPYPDTLPNVSSARLQALGVDPDRKHLCNSMSAMGAAGILLSMLLLAVWCFARVMGRAATLSSCDVNVTCGSGDMPVIYGGRCLQLRQVQETPAATIVEGLLTSDECAHMLNHVALAAAASGITQSDHTPQRTGTVLCLRHQSGDLVLAGMLSRLSKLLGVPKDRFEECQMVLYGDSEHYSLHHDCLEPRRLSRLPSHQRVATVLVYLTDLPASCGGGTSFPRFNGLAGYEATPVAGSALFWSNVDGAGLPEPLSVHEALPVRGEGVRKVAINVWVRGEAWDTPTTRLRILLKQLAPWCFPAAEVAQTFCPNCGQYIGTEARFRDKRLHSSRCPIHKM